MLTSNESGVIPNEWWRLISCGWVHPCVSFCHRSPQSLSWHPCCRWWRSSSPSSSCLWRRMLGRPWRRHSWIVIRAWWTRSKRFRPQRCNPGNRGSRKHTHFMIKAVTISIWTLNEKHFWKSSHWQCMAWPDCDALKHFYRSLLIMEI